MTRRLIDDCFLQPGPRLSHDAALRILRERITPTVGHQQVALTDTLGRTLAAPVIAPHPVPNHTNSAVDGYAFAAATCAAGHGATLPVVGRSAAGHPMTSHVPASAAVRIFTGAVVPPGLDTVAMQEDCSADETASTPTVAIPAGLKVGANVRNAGEDVASGTTLYQPGHIVRPQDLAALASIGMHQVPCWRRLTVAVVSTGDEVLRPTGAALPPGKVFDANAPMLLALAALAGAVPTDLGIWPDDAATVRTRLADAATGADVILTSGGASRGEEDHMAAALGHLGAYHFWQIQIKPGRPMMMGQIGDTVVVGLPGNPVAAFVCFLMYVWPMLRRLGGAPWSEPRRIAVPADFDMASRKTGRREFWRGRLVDGPNGFVVRKYERDGSGLISSLREADCLIDVPEDVPSIARGAPVMVVPLTEFGITPG